MGGLISLGFAHTTNIFPVPAKACEDEGWCFHNRHLLTGSLKSLDVACLFCRFNEIDFGVEINGHGHMIMSSNVGRNLRAGIWPSVSPLFNGGARRTPIFSHHSYGITTARLGSGIPHNTSRFTPTLSKPTAQNGVLSAFTIRGGSRDGLRSFNSITRLSGLNNTNTVEKEWNIATWTLDRRKSSTLLQYASRRRTHSSSHRSAGFGRNKSSDSKKQDVGQSPSDQPPRLSPTSTSKDSATAVKAIATSITNKHLIDRLPHMPQMHRPSKEEILAAATGFWSRLKLRFKWFSIRSARPFNADEIGAFLSWVLLGHVIWIVVGTTTFFSLAIFAVNTVFAQETLARWVGNYLTKSSGIKVVFESAIVPKWGDGVITFKNVFVSRRPGQGAGRVSKGSPETAAAAAAAADRSRDANPASQTNLDEEDTNYTQFDVSLETVNVTLSFAKWFNSRGLLQNVEIKGVRGVIDRTSVHWSGQHIDPKTYRHEHNPGDFEIDSFKMEDLLVTIYQPKGFRPFSVSIFSCDLPKLRKQYLFYDFLSANMMSGSFDDSLFTIHPRQIHGHTGSQVLFGTEPNGQPSTWKKQSRLRIDGLNIDHLNRGVEGPFSWIHEGNVDIVADIMFPADNDEGIAKVVSDLYDRMEATVTSSHQITSVDGVNIIHNESSHVPIPQEAPIPPPIHHEDGKFLVMDLRVHLNDVRAAVPIFTKDLSYVNNALIRPIVAYINTRRTFIPINCRVIKHVSDFDGSWTIFDSGLMDDLSAEVSL